MPNQYQEEFGGSRDIKGSNRYVASTLCKIVMEQEKFKGFRGVGSPVTGQESPGGRRRCWMHRLGATILRALVPGLHEIRCRIHPDRRRCEQECWWAGIAAEPAMEAGNDYAVM